MNTNCKEHVATNPETPNCPEDGIEAILVPPAEIGTAKDEKLGTKAPGNGSAEKKSIAKVNKPLEVV